MVDQNVKRVKDIVGDTSYCLKKEDKRIGHMLYHWYIIIYSYITILIILIEISFHDAEYTPIHILIISTMLIVIVTIICIKFIVFTNKYCIYL